MTVRSSQAGGQAARLVRRGFWLEYASMARMTAEAAVAITAGVAAGPVALILNATAGWWWADPAAGYVLVYYAAREVRDIFPCH